MTKTFENEVEAKNFARARFDEGLTVHAGTINPHSPRQLISSRNILSWLHDEAGQAEAGPSSAPEEEK